MFSIEESKQVLMMILSCITDYPGRAMNCENYQLFLSNGAINLSQLRTTYDIPTQTVML